MHIAALLSLSKEVGGYLTRTLMLYISKLDKMGTMVKMVNTNLMVIMLSENYKNVSVGQASKVHGVIPHYG